MKIQTGFFRLFRTLITLGTVWGAALVAVPHSVYLRGLRRTLGLGGLLALALSLSVQAQANADRVGDFALLDHTGKFHQLSWYGDQKAVVVVAQDDCGAGQREQAGLAHTRR